MRNLGAVSKSEASDNYRCQPSRMIAMGMLLVGATLRRKPPSRPAAFRKKSGGILRENPALGDKPNQARRRRRLSTTPSTANALNAATPPLPRAGGLKEHLDEAASAQSLAVSATAFAAT